MDVLASIFPKMREVNMPEQALLSAKELARLKQMCYTGFVGLGSVLRPEHLKCLETRRATRRVTVVVQTPTDAGARKWNEFHERQIRIGGHLVTIAVATTIYLYSGGTAGFLVGTGASLIKDELQARIWYPRLERGWSLRRTSDFVYEQTLHEWLTWSGTDVITNHQGVQQEKKVHGSHRLEIGGPHGIPREIAASIISRPSGTKTVIIR